MSGVYYHIPFCKSTCAYCDFFKSADLSRMDQVVEAMHRELDSRKDYLSDRSVRTIYFGGGTPSLCRPVLLEGLVNHLRELFDCDDVQEFTVEVNPDDVDAAYLSELRRIGVNRLSIGIQSFCDDELKLMNRRHNGTQAIEVVKLAQSMGFDNITIDLIFGVSDFGGDYLRDSVQKAIELGVQHISAYHLTIEPNTLFGKRTSKGEFSAVADSVSSQEYRMVHDALTGAGFEHYEVSNYALPGFRAKHNSAYWSGDQYLGIGPSAHSFNGENRHWAVSSISKYVNDLASEEELLSEVDNYNEYIMTSLRIKEGLDIDNVRERYGVSRVEQLVKDAQRYIDSGSLVLDGSRLYIPEENFLISDAVISDLFQVE